MRKCSRRNYGLCCAIAKMSMNCYFNRMEHRPIMALVSDNSVTEWPLPFSMDRPPRANRVATQITWFKSPRLLSLGVLKDKVFRRKPRTIADLKAVIEEEWTTISPHLCNKVVCSVIHRFTYCLNENGNHFEHLHWFMFSCFNVTVGIHSAIYLCTSKMHFIVFHTIRATCLS